MEYGYIKLHRNLIDNPLWNSNDEKFTRGQAWVDLLFIAAFKPKTLTIRGFVFNIQPGQLIWSQKRLAERWGWGNKRVAKFLEELKNNQQISVKQHHRISVTSILNWDKYQGIDTASDTTDNTTDNTLTKKVKESKSNTKVLGTKPEGDKSPKSYGNEIVNTFLDYLKDYNKNIQPVAPSQNILRKRAWNALQKLGVRNGMKVLADIPQPTKDTMNAFFEWLAKRPYAIENINTLNMQVNNFLTNYYEKSN